MATMKSLLGITLIAACLATACSESARRGSSDTGVPGTADTGAPPASDAGATSDAGTSLDAGATDTGSAVDGGAAPDATAGIDAGTQDGTVEFRFSVSQLARGSGDLVDPLRGAIYGAIYNLADVTITGPRDGATEIADVLVPAVDLETNEPSMITWQSGPIAPGEYTFLAFLDVDGNGGDVREPDDGDPVTFPRVNQFTIAAGEDVQLTVVFGLIF